MQRMEYSSLKTQFRLLYSITKVLISKQRVGFHCLVDFLSNLVDC